MEIPCVLVRKSTKEILNANCNYPRTDDGPIEGLDPDLLYLAKYIPYAEPDYDPRTHILITNYPDLLNMNLDEIPAHPDHEHIQEYRILYTTQKRENSEICAMVDLIESASNEEVFPTQSFKKDLTISIAALFEHQNRNQWSDEELAALNRIIGRGVGFNQNDAIGKAKKLIINAGGLPDLDSDWNTTPI